MCNTILYIGRKDSAHHSAPWGNFWDGFKDENKGNGKFKVKRGKQKIGKTFYTEKEWGTRVTSITKSMDTCIIMIASSYMCAIY